MELKRLDVKSTCLVFGLVNSVFGFLVGIIIAFNKEFAMLFARGGFYDWLYSLGWKVILFLPVFDFVMGLIVGLIVAVVYNFISKKGIRLKYN